MRSQPVVISKESLQLMQYEQRKLIIHVWTSAVNPSYPGAHSGHVSIEIPSLKQYISLWPGKPVRFTESVDSTLQKNLIDDIRLEGDRRPELTFCFYTLELHGVGKRWEQFQASLPQWSLLGACKDTRNCASLAWDLLEAGSIGKLTGPLTRSSVWCGRGTKGGAHSKEDMVIASSQAMLFRETESKAASARAMGESSYSSEMIISLIVKSPDALAELLQKAKTKELESHPLTKQIVVEGEWKKPEKESCKGCVIS